MRALGPAAVLLLAAGGCGLSIDAAPQRGDGGGGDAAPGDAAVVPLDDGASLDAASLDAARSDAPVAPLDVGMALGDATESPDAGALDAGTPCAPDTHWPDDGSCGPVLFSDAFDGGTMRMEWVLLRTNFEVRDGHLASLLEARSLESGGTFPYGHSRNGRGGIAAVNVDGSLGRWTDYRLDWTQRAWSTDETFTGTTPLEFAPSGCIASPSAYFRAQSITESWNEPPGATYYSFGIMTGAASACLGMRGEWVLGALDGYWMYGTGYNPAASVGFGGTLVGSPPAFTFRDATDGPHDYAIEVRGATIAVWVDGISLASHTDSAATMIGPDGTTRAHTVLTYGGVAFTAAYDEPFWIDDVVVTALP